MEIDIIKIQEEILAEIRKEKEKTDEQMKQWNEELEKIMKFISNNRLTEFGKSAIRDIHDSKLWDIKHRERELSNEEEHLLDKGGHIIEEYKILIAGKDIPKITLKTIPKNDTDLGYLIRKYLMLVRIESYSFCDNCKGVNTIIKYKGLIHCYKCDTSFGPWIDMCVIINY